MSESRLAALREPFPDEVVGKLPRNIRDGPKANCKVCHGYHAPAMLHLDYVGHAEVTDRLLSVDPLWSWEPFALDERGLPAVDRDKDNWPRGLWIRLTICGVTRPGYGTCEARKSDAVKELIGDALRNAAMRFGVALDLWAKQDLESAVSPLWVDQEEGAASSKASGTTTQLGTQDRPAEESDPPVPPGSSAGELELDPGRNF